MENMTVYLNGDYLPLNEAKISVLDRGFLFGDGVYEVIPCYQGHLFEFNAHMQRLEKSLAGIQLVYHRPLEEWRQIVQPLIDSARNQYIYLHLTRGVATKRDHAFPANTAPTVFAMCSDIIPVTAREHGFKGVTFNDNRWHLCHIKSTALLANVLLKQQAIETNQSEAILIKKGYVTEGASSNLFALINGVLTTPPLTNDILPGITREVILKIAKVNQIKTAEQPISEDALRNADEIWLVSSTREILPVIELDGCKVAEGKVGNLWRTVNTLFQNYKNLSHE
ncbi:MAG: aminotransferase class IV [Methylococcales bacterium]|nr:aminotransferase class IV [Methylococcales bacterium]